MAQLSDYVIDLRELSWPELLASWAWLLPSGFTVWLANKFGDLFIVLGDGSVSMVDVGRGTIERVADSRDSFAARLNEDETANNWLMIPLVDQLTRGGLVPGPGECYSYVRLPVLGGAYSTANTRVLPIGEHYAAFGPIHEKLKGVRDGERIRFDVEPPEPGRRRTRG